MSPSVVSAAVEQSAVLLCSSGAPFVCEGGGCCDVDQFCETICQGG